ncbi:LysR family transcriptional regulator [Bordetella trematum]|uniref:LysR family transcriptional regulator n=1 Tax=Bordetella trematum TaxID=123899 RepID=UPI001405344B|nr:LysR family transcriptional regulator [Bordetella trematum]QIM72403.1 LysR family transcriptional regulator [Bordetella trematum]
MELRHLRYFVVVAEEEHITRAAQRLGMQQPPLSAQIRDLERELGVALFDRAPRRIRLNAAGQAFLEDARRILAQAEQAALRAQRAARGETGQLSIGYTSSAALHPAVPRVLRAFHERYPQVALETRENATRDLLQAVADGELDAVFVRAPAARFPTLQSLELCREPMVAALPAGHPLARRRPPLPLAALRDEGFVRYRRADGPGVDDALQAAALRAGFNPRTAVQVPRLLSALTLVAAGRGVALVPRTLHSLHRESVVYRRLDAGGGFTIPLNLVARSEPGRPPLQHFLELIREMGPHETASP